MRVLFFGRLAEIAGGRTRDAPDDIASLAALRDYLTEVDPILAQALLSAGVRAAVNKIVATGDVALAPGDEVAFMPPLSGG